ISILECAKLAEAFLDEFVRFVALLVDALDVLLLELADVFVRLLFVFSDLSVLFEVLPQFGKSRLATRHGRGCRVRHRAIRVIETSANDDKSRDRANQRMRSPARPQGVDRQDEQRPRETAAEVRSLADAGNLKRQKRVEQDDADQLTKPRLKHRRR